MNEIRTMSGQEAFDEVTNMILGDDYYIVDPLSNAQANPIILDDIRHKYNRINVEWLALVIACMTLLSLVIVLTIMLICQ